MDKALALEAREIARHRNINETIARGDSPVQQFYAGAVVLVTGASGFLGKQLVEKLLRACAVKKIFILLRANKRGTAQDRMKKIVGDPVFECVREVQPDFGNKIVAVSGDISKPGLGISDSDRNDITEQVTIIFHAAATVSFTEPLKKATITNVNGITEMIRTAKECKNLKSFVHISTAYTHATLERENQDVLEQFYDTTISPDALMTLVQGTDEAILDAMTPTIIKGWPNTYTFTKAVGEEAVRTMAANLPICIVRPAIVLCAYREPVPGWVDRKHVFGPSGLIVGALLGIIHVLYADPVVNMDLVPVDIVNNATIAAAHATAERRERGLNDIKIYTVCTQRNPISYGRMVELLIKEGIKYTTILAMWLNFVFAIKSTLLFNLMHFFMHLLPGYLVDGTLLLVGKKPMLTNVYNKMYKLSTVLGYFKRHDWIFGDANLYELHKSLCPADRVIFNCNTDNIDWKVYMLLWLIGCRKYILKDGLKDTEKAYRRQFWLRILNYTVGVGYAYLIYKIFFITFQCVWYVIM